MRGRKRLPKTEEIFISVIKKESPNEGTETVSRLPDSLLQYY